MPFARPRTSSDCPSPLRCRRRQADPFEKRWFEGFARPRRLLVIGGKTSLWRFDPSLITDGIDVLKSHAERDGGSILAVTSPRTSPELLAAASVASAKRQS